MLHRVVDLGGEDAGALRKGPSLTCYVPDPIEMRPQYKRTSVVVCPGGGYEVLWETEREAVALKYLAEGFNVFVLNYSVIPKQYPTQLLELARTIDYIRLHHDEFGADPERIFVCGFSAGGHLAANLGVAWNKDYLLSLVGHDSNHKPNGIILGYPVVTTDDDDLICFYERLIGKDPSPELMDAVSLEKQVDSDTVPVFMWGTYEDPLVRHILVLGLELLKNRIPFEALIYQRGPHGMSLANEVTAIRQDQNVSHCSDWFAKSVEWIREF